MFKKCEFSITLTGNLDFFTVKGTCSYIRQEWLSPPQTVFVGGYTVFTLSDRPSECVSVTFCFLNILENH